LSDGEIVKRRGILAGMAAGVTGLGGDGATAQTLEWCFQNSHAPARRSTSPSCVKAAHA
jgi:hypothetical protein